MDTIFAYITPKSELVSIFNEIDKYDFICPECFWDNNIRAAYNLLCSQDFVNEQFVCDHCKMSFKPLEKI